MFYADGNEARIGDLIAIDKKNRGIVVASIDDDDYSEDCPRETWKHLLRGILVDTDFGGLVHYPDSASDDLRLLQRSQVTKES